MSCVVRVSFEIIVIAQDEIIATSVHNDQGGNKSYVDQHVAKAGDTMTGNLNMDVNRIYNLPTSTGNAQPATKLYADNKFLPLAGDTMAGVLAMGQGNNKITGLPQATQNGDAIDFEFFNKYVPTGFRDTNGKPTHQKDQFKYLMQNKLEWTDQYGNSFNMVKIADLFQHDRNPHTYNHKVIYTTINKISDTNFDYKLGIQCFSLNVLKTTLYALNSLTQITSCGVRVLYPSIKPHHRG